MTLEDLNALSPDALKQALSGSPADVLALLQTAAEGGVVDAQLMVGQAYLDGAGAQADARQAVRWFARAAEAGHPMGMNMLGRCYEHGWGVALDKARAAEWYRAAADRGLDWGLYNLATALTLGEGVPIDRGQALALFRKASAMGHAKSTNMIGSFYEDGWVVDRDMAAAADHFRRAAEGGDFRGMFNHARMLLLAGGRDEALVWLKQIPEAATPAFIVKVRDWLRAREPALADAYSSTAFGTIRNDHAAMSPPQ